MTTTLEEKQRELDALQSAFDDYIASSRELEEELEAELTKCREFSSFIFLHASVPFYLASLFTLPHSTFRLTQRTTTGARTSENDLTKAESYNAALSAQLANTQPQMNSLETRVSALSSQLSSESTRRVSAETKSEEAECRLRESEGALAAVRSSEVRKLREENEDLCERLAFVEGEAEDYRNELNAERDRHREEVEELGGDVHALATKLRQREEELDSLRADAGSYIGNISVGEVGGRGGGDDDVDDIFDATLTPSASVEALRGAETSSATRDEREEYIKTLEEELELVTEQLIEAETRLSRTQAELEEALVEAEQQSHEPPEDSGMVMNGSSATVGDAADSETNTRLSEKIDELESSLKRIEEENVYLREESKRLREELDLVLEELALSKEELEAHDEDRRERAVELDLERNRHKEEVAALRGQIEKFSSEERYREIQSKSMEEALVESKEETQTLREEVERLEVALRNSKEDWEALQDEMGELRTAFDEMFNRESVEINDQNQAQEELLATRSREIAKLLLQVCDSKEEVTKLTSVNVSMAKMLKDAEDNVMNHRTELERQRTHVASASASSSQELEDARDAIYSLEGLLEAARKELDEQKNEVAVVRSSLQETILHTQRELTTTQEELFRTRSKLMEVDKDRSGGDAESRTETASTLQVECNRLEDQNRMSMSMIRRLENEIMQLQGQSMSADASNTSPGPIEIDEKENDPVSGLICMDDYNIDDILRSNDLEVIAKEVRAMAKKMSAQKSHNAELLTRILKLQGNIQVCCRIRPMTAGESQQGLHEVALSLSETEVGCFDERTRSWKSFAFDKVWGPESRQKDVFQDVEPLALSVIDGYNACIFAYGQSGYIFSLFLFLFMLVIYAMNILTIFFIRAKQLEVGRHLQWKAASWTINTVSVRGRSRKSSACCKRRLSSTSEITGTGNCHHYSTIRLKSVC
jgi:predicted  nucleic acid-binding Zn-ribbon protein